MECRQWWDKGLGLKSGKILSTSSELLSLHMNWNMEGVAFEILTPFSWFWALYCWDGVRAFPWVSGESPGIIVLMYNWDVNCILHIRIMDGVSSTWGNFMAFRKAWSDRKSLVQVLQSVMVKRMVRAAWWGSLAVVRLINVHAACICHCWSAC